MPVLMTFFRHDLPIEAFDRRFRTFTLANAVLEELATGFRWLEGPVWMGDWGCLLVQDIPSDRTVRWDETSGATVWRSPSGFANGQTRDREGRLVACSHLHRHVARRRHDGRWEVLADRHRGRRLNAPNDVALHPDGSIWFTDPLYGIANIYEGADEPSEQPPALYRIDPSGRLDAISRDFAGPNGLAFTADGTRLFLSDTGAPFADEPDRVVRAFGVETDGTRARLSGGEVFVRAEPGYCDGMAVDAGGCLWCSAGDGVRCFDPAGEPLGRIGTPRTVSNLCFGGADWNRLFICAWDTLFAITLNRRGVPLP